MKRQALLHQFILAGQGSLPIGGALHREQAYRSNPGARRRFLDSIKSRRRRHVVLERLQGILGGRRIFARQISSLVANARLGLVVRGAAASGLVGDHRAAIYGEPRRKPWRFNSKLMVGAGAAVALVTSFAGAAHGQVVVSTQFDETIIIGSDTFETPAGTVLFTTDAVGYSDWLSPIIAGDLAGDSALPIQIQSTASLVPEVSEYQFLSEQGPNYIIPGAGPAFTPTLPSLTDALSAELEALGGPGYSLVSETPSVVAVQSFSTGAFEPNGDLLDGTVLWSIYDWNLVEEPVSAVPEPPSWAMMLIGVGLLGGYLMRERVRHVNRIKGLLAGQGIRPFGSAIWRNSP